VINSEILALIMLGLFMFFIMIGYPVAFTFAGTATVFFLIGWAQGDMEPAQLNGLFNRWFADSAANFTFLAIPFFVFMGAIFEKSGLAERLLTTIGLMLGPVRGGMAVAVVIVGTLLAAATGVVAATVIVMGVLSLPVMVKYGYDHELASGVIVASGTLAQLMPPSLVLIVLAQFIPVSVGQLFAGALIPGIMLSAMFIGYSLMVAYSKPNSAPPIPREERTLTRGQLAKQFLLAVVPPLGLILAVLGSIFRGYATASEAGAVGAVGAALLALVYGRLSFKVLWSAARATSNITSLVLQILLASTFFALVFDRLGGQDRITAWLENVPGGLWGFIIASHIIVFLLGINLEFLEISFIVMPLFIPAAIALDVNLVWFAVLMAVNLNLAFISPPVGFSLFYLQSVAPPEVKTSEIHRGAIPFMGVQVIGLIVLTLLPESVVYLVSASGLGNETTNNTDFIPGTFAVRLLICIVMVGGLGALWSWRIRRKYGTHDDPDPDADFEPAVASA
jgi:tripartite ATP-independent transporter DctM subunit